MEFWKYLYAELGKAAGDMKCEDKRIYDELKRMQERAAWVFDDWREFGALDQCTIGSRRAYGERKRAASLETREIAAEAEEHARSQVIASYNQ